MGTRNSYIILVLIRNVNSFSNIFLFYSPKDSAADFFLLLSQLCCADSPLSEGAFPPASGQAGLPPEGGGIAKQWRREFQIKKAALPCVQGKAAHGSIQFRADRVLLLVCCSQLSGNSLVALLLTALQILTHLRQTGTGGDQLTDDDVLLQAGQRVNLALMAASVRTRVVSWKDAADRKDSFARAALVMPSSTC